MPSKTITWMGQGIVAIGPLLVGASVVEAAVYTWTTDAAGPSDWNNSANWTQSPDTGFPNAAGAIANLTNNITVNNVIDLEQAITIGVLNIGDSTATASTFNTFTVQKGTGSGSLALNNGSAASQINATGGTSTIDSSVAIAFQAGQNVEIDVASGALLNFLGVSASTVTGGHHIIKTGPGRAQLGRVRTYTNTGDVIVRDGLLTEGRLRSGSRVIVNGPGIYQATDFNLTLASIHGSGQFRPHNSVGAVIGDRGAGIDQTQHKLVVTAGGKLYPGDDEAVADGIGSLTLFSNSALGSFRSESGGAYYFDIAGDDSFDTIEIGIVSTSEALIDGGDVHLNFLSGYLPADGQAFKLFSMTHPNGGAYEDHNGGDLFDNIYLNIPGSMTAALSDFNTTAGNFRSITFTYSVPEPGAVMLVGLIGGLGLLRRRSK